MSAESDVGPIFVVCAVREAGDPVPNVDADDVFVIPNDSGPLNLSAKWNRGIQQAEEAAARAGYDRWNVAVLNDDVRPEPGLLGLVALGQLIATSIDVLAGQTVTGWAFMLRGEIGLRFDERFRWWYGDSDIERQVRHAGKLTVCVGGAHAHHRGEMRSTSSDPSLLALAHEDEARYAEKWGLDPGTLWLALNPGWPGGAAPTGFEPMSRP